MSLATIAAAATAALIAGEVHPLPSELPQLLAGGDDNGVTSLDRSSLYRASHACATLNASHGSPSDWYSFNLVILSLSSGIIGCQFAIRFGS